MKIINVDITNTAHVHVHYFLLEKCENLLHCNKDADQLHS